VKFANKSALLKRSKHKTTPTKSQEITLETVKMKQNHKTLAQVWGSCWFI